jgi:RNA polymerase sigma-70 factor (ECF subfamily)
VRVVRSEAPLARSEDLFGYHADWLRQLLSRRLRSQPADIDDLVQETYLRAIRRPVAEISHPKAYLSQIALNLFRDTKRREAVRADHRRAVQSDVTQGAGPATGMSDQEASVELVRLIRDMPEPFRDVFTLSRFRHMTNRDIAAHLEISVKTVEWRMGKALDYCLSRLRD